MKSCFSISLALAFIFSLFFSTPEAQAQSATCEALATDTEKILCYVKENSARLTALEQVQASIADWTSPSWSFDQGWCVDFTPVAGAVNLGGFFEFDGKAKGHGGVDGYGSGAAGEAKVSAGFTADATYSPSAGLTGTYCINAPTRPYDGPQYTDVGKRSGAFTNMTTPDLETMLQQNIAMQGGLEGVMGDMTLLLGNSIAEFPGKISGLTSAVSFPDQPSDMFTSVKTLGAALVDMIPVPESVKAKIADPTLGLQAEMSVDQLCKMVLQLPNTPTWAETRRFCNDGFPVADPEAFAVASVELQGPNTAAITEIQDKVNAFLPTVGDATNRGNQITDTNGDTNQMIDQLADIASTGNSTLGIGVTVNQIWDRVDRLTGSNSIATSLREGITVTNTRVNHLTAGSDAFAETMRNRIMSSGDRINHFLPTNETATNRSNQIQIASSAATGALDRLRIPDETDLFGARMWGYFGVIDKIRDLVGKACGNLGCEPYRDDSGLGGIRSTESVLGSSGSSTEGLTGGIGVNSEEDFLNLVVPDEYFMDAAYPNPSQSSVRVQFGLPQAESVRLRLFDTAGREVNTGIDRSLPAGRHSLDLDLSGLASGTYFYRIEAGPWVSSKTITVSK